MGLINEHDMTKRMMSAMKDGSVGKALNENQEAGVETSAKDVIELTGEERKNEEQKFREVLGNLVEFNVFNIYPKAGNVVFGGIFQGMDGLQFQFTLEDSNGLYVTANNMQVTSEVVETIQKLKGYYDNWKEEWANKMATEYRQ